MKKRKIAIVGAGASGIFCAIFCAKNGANVVVYEQNTKPAKKILVSGNGRCNISNRNLNLNNYFGENPNFVSYALEQFGFHQFEKFCEEIGLLLNTLEDGRAYPLSNEAKSVAKIFEDYAHSLGVVFHNDTKITTIKPLLEDNDAVVIATGSRAAEHLGGNNDGELFAQEFDHSVISAYPSLVQLHLHSKIVKKMSGTKLNAELTLLVNAKKESSVTGDLLFTNYGISGFAVLDISQSASEALLNYQAVDVSINLLPTFNMQKLSQHIANLAEKQPMLTLLYILVGLIPIKIVHALLEELNISHKLKGQEIHTKLAKKIANKMLNWKFEVSDTHGFRHAEVSGGGINTLEVDEKTMMSKKKKNLYFTGEVLDIVGKRGGYNFAFAWASAYLAARDITKS
jgi:hypothetical protein